MNAGSIARETAAGRVYRYLRNRPGRWISNWELAEQCRTVAVSTRVSEVRSQMPSGEVLDHRTRTEGREVRHEYRITVARERAGDVQERLI